MESKEGRSAGVVGSARSAVTRLEGVRLRDEFICPITHELLREPVIAGDGYTYEKTAIEKWFLSKETSPLTGSSIPRSLTPNLTLKKLIQDLINEGAAGLYATDSHGRVLDVRAERFLNLRCLGPEATDWYRQSFQVTPRGCIGGRRPNFNNSPTPSRDIVTFKDGTVSRRHFEIILTAPGQYSIRDLASAGGTFIRILYGKRKELLQGMIIMLGKHQFVVSSMCSLDEAAGVVADSVAGANAIGGSGSVGSISASTADEKLNNGGQSKPLRSVKSEPESKHALGLDRGGGSKSGGDGDSSSCNDDESLETCSTPTDRSPNQKPHSEQRGYSLQAGDSMYDARCCVVTCCAPEGSPLVGRSFTVGSKGGTMGRDPACAVPLCRVLESEKVSSSVAGVAKLDSAISAEHARIEMDLSTGKFFLIDGTPSKPSTNGTWFRLSGPAQESAPFHLRAGDEVLFGTLRFQVSERMTISEQEVNEAGDQDA